MSIDKAIKELERAKAEGRTDVIIAWWFAEAFNLPDNEDWASISDIANDEMDWSRTHDDLSTLVDEIKNS